MASKEDILNHLTAVEIYSIYEPCIYDNTTPNKDSNIIYGDDKIVEQNDNKLEEHNDDIIEKDNKKIVCDGCFKNFSTNSSLKRHLDRSPVCQKWLDLEKEKPKEIEPSVSLVEYLDRNPVCQMWLTLEKEKEKPKEIEPIVSFVEYIDNIKMKFTSSDSKTSCKYCSTHYTSVRNLNKHYKVSTVCNRFAYMDFQKEMKNRINFY